MYSVLLFVLYFTCLLSFVDCAFYPTGCAYDIDSSAVGKYRCDYTLSLPNFPIRYTNFSEPFPQRIVFYGISGTLPAYATFDAFDSFNYTYQSNDYKNSLELICSDGGSLQWGVGTFTWMTYLHEVTIKSCNLPSGLISSAFSDFGSLDHLILDGCTIPITATDTFSGLNITKMSDIPDPRGELTITNCDLSGGNFSNGFFDLLTEASALDLSNTGLTNLDVNMFAQMSKVKKINLAHNAFTTLPSNIFHNNTALAVLDLTGIAWDCSCDNLWFLDYASSNYIDIEGPIICNTPTAGVKARLFFSENCRTYDVCDAIPGIAIGIDCFEWFQILSYAFTGATLIISICALVIVSTYRRHMYVSEKQLLFVKKAKAIRVLEALKRGGGGGSKAPAKTDLPPKDSSWAIPTIDDSNLD
ncbi:hypothetical protein FSP39_000917 [Pinctada imbricata]|uniref:Uncharacterized protein n=1 Tax=Pinctada imbricata TaxID=66713 RepID=A0AA88YMI4_PINIB|nr:hypothetical protein FSP39_000917 [Pinctada imbricata]